VKKQDRKKKRPRSRYQVPLENRPLTPEDPSVRERLREVEGHELRLEDLKHIPLEELEKLSDEEAAILLRTWELWARPNQLEPPRMLPNGVMWTIWLILAGRGFGKTRTGSETIIKWVREGTCERIALIAEDSADARDVMVEGESGILACSSPDFMPKYEPSKRRLTWPNGAVATLFSAEDFDSLRGPQFDGAWCDELCKWRYAEETWDNLMFGLRLGEHPRVIVTTTPRPIKMLKNIILRNDTYITKGNTRENLANLAEPFKKAVIEKYEGTRIGRQELDAELLDDTPGALWNRGMLDKLRLRPVDPSTPLILPDLKRVVVSVDPPATESAEAGITACAIDHANKGYVLEDASLSGSPDEWGRAAIILFDEWEADMLVYEANHGGEMVAAVLRAAARALREEGRRTTDFVPLKAVHATRGKYVRAEPVSQLYEQGKVHHVGTFPLLEDQMCEYTPEGNMGYSPDRLDSLVWALTELMVGQIASEGLMDYYRQEHAAIQGRLSGELPSPASGLVSLHAVDGTNIAFGSGGEKYPLLPDGTFQVAEKDVAPLLAAGFMRAFNG
jgi:phage terminase large subunit-like protein